MTNERTAAVGEFVQVLLADKDCACGLQLLYNVSIFGGNTVSEDCACGSASNSGGVDQVLQADRDSLQWAAPGAVRDFFFRQLGFLERRFCCDGAECVQGGVEAFGCSQAFLG